MATRRRTAYQEANPWKWAALGLGGVLALIFIVGVVTATYREGTAPPPVAVEKHSAAPAHRVIAADAPARVESRPVAARPSAAEIDECNRVASSAHNSRTRETITDALIGGATGAALGAAGGAIAGGGRGAGKGAGIGGLVGATAGTLYGLNKSNSNDTEATRAYQVCMSRKGF